MDNEHLQVYTPEKDDYHLTVAALGSIGLRNSHHIQIIPEYEELIETIDLPTSKYLANQAKYGDAPELVFHVPLSPVLNLRQFLCNFNDQQALTAQVKGKLWHNIPAMEFNQGQHSLGFNVMLRDLYDPFNRRLPVNDKKEAGLVYANREVGDQRRLLNREQKMAAKQGVKLASLSFTAYMVAQSKRRLIGEEVPMLDSHTATLFVAHNTRSESGNSVIPRAVYMPEEDVIILGSAKTKQSQRLGNRGVRRQVLLEPIPIRG